MYLVPIYNITYLPIFTSFSMDTNYVPIPCVGTQSYRYLNQGSKLTSESKVLYIFFGFQTDLK